MRSYVKLAVAVLISLGSTAANALPVVTLSTLGDTTSSVAGVTTIDFNSGAFGYASCSG